MKNYIGITGVQTPEQLQEISDFTEQIGLHTHATHQVMVGALCSKEMFANRKLNSRHVGSLDDLGEMMERGGKHILKMLHMEIDKDPSNHDLFAQSADWLLAVSWQENCRAMQVNGIPLPMEMKFLRGLRPELRIVYQVRQKLLRAGMPTLVEHMQRCGVGQSVHDALIDPSGGTGVLFPISTGVEQYKALHSEFPTMQIGFAGGFTPDNVQERTRELAHKLGHNLFSIDVETGVRNEKDDSLNMGKVKEYLEAAKEGFGD